jgi:hypothetical protein
VSVNTAQRIAAQTVKADYRFQNTRASSVGSAPDLIDIGTNGANTFAAETIDGVPRTVLQFPVSNGLRLAQVTGVAPNDVYTIVILFEFDNISNLAYKRILDFKNGTSENGFYLNNRYLSFYIGRQIAGGTMFLAPNTYHQVVLTRNAAGTVTSYVDGVRQFSFDDSTSRAAVIDSNNALRFFRDNKGSNEHSNGSIARIRLFDTALTDFEVAALDRFLAAPTSAQVTIGGRVRNAAGRGVSRALVTLTGSNGETRTALTNGFGYYRFADVAAGDTYVLNVVSKRYQFTAQVISVTEETSELNFVAESERGRF